MHIFLNYAFFIPKPVQTTAKKSIEITCHFYKCCFLLLFFFFTDIVSKYELLGVPLKIEYSNKLKVCRYNFLLSITFVGLVMSSLDAQSDKTW